MGHDSEAYTKTWSLSPAQTKAVEMAQQDAARDAYQRAARNASRQYGSLTGQPDGFVPVVNSITPNTKVANSGNFSLTAIGSNFTDDTKIFFGATELPTTPGNPLATGCWATVPNALIPAAGTVQVTLKTDGSTSVAKPFTIT